MRKIILSLLLIISFAELNAQTNQLEKVQKTAKTFSSLFNSDSLEKTLPLFKEPQENDIIQETLFPKLIRLKKIYGKIKSFRYEVYGDIKTLQCLFENKSWISLDIDYNYKIQSIKFTEPSDKTVYTLYTHTEIKNSTVKSTETLALYKGKKNYSNSSESGYGTNVIPSDIDYPNGAFYGDDGSGFDNKPLALSNFKNLVKPDDDGQETGTIMVKINVNRQGKIVNAIAGVKGTTFKNQTLFRKCEKAILKASLNAIAKGPDIRIFYVPFRFSVNNQHPF